MKKNRDKEVKISIVVPIFNSENSLEKCINSIIEQNYQNIEIILVDDGSTDRSYSICCEFVEKDKRVIAIHKENGGPVSARKMGIIQATGDYIINIDSDDWVEKEWVSEWVIAITSSECDAVYRDGVFRENSNGSIYISANLTPRKYLYYDFEKEIVPLIFDKSNVTGKSIKLNSVSWSFKSGLIKSLINDVNEKYFIEEDLVLDTYCIFNSKSLYITNGGGYHYIQHNGSLSTKQLCEQMICDIELDVTTFLKKKGMSLDTILTYKKMLQVNAICHNYKSLIRNENDSLPFLTKIEKESKIILYGAGRVGHSVYEGLKENIHYEIVAMVDKNVELNESFPIKIIRANEVKNMEFDYIVICSIVKQNVETMVRTLEEYRIPKEKIVCFEI